MNLVALKRLQHVDGHLGGEFYQTENLNRICGRIIGHESDAASTRLGLLQSYIQAKGISSWFHTGDVHALKNWFYNFGRLGYICGNPPFGGTPRLVVYEDRALEGMFYLVSDCEPLIEWYSHLDKRFYGKGVDSIKSCDFFTKQFFIALRGEWDLLAERCERLLANPPTGSREKKFIIDHQFYLALAKGDVEQMTAIICELVSPRRIANRSGLETGFTNGLICMPAISYCKLAWRNGYEIAIDSPYIPKEWLAIKPLEKYEDAFEFMKNFPVRSK